VVVRRETLGDAMRDTHQLPGAAERELQPARGFDIHGLLACLAISIFSIVWITLASGSFKPRAVVFLLALPWILLSAGSVITAVLRLPSFFALDFLLGVAVVSVCVMAWKMFVPLSLWVLMIVVMVAVVAVARILPPSQRDRLSALGLLSVIISLVVATGWSQDLIFPTTPINGAVVFKPWSDFFVHATLVARGVCAETLFQTGNYEWKGFPAIFYHYASYALAWCLAKAGRLPAYATAVGFWAPFGSFLTGLASYSLGRAMWNRSAGLAALVATFLIPDAGLLNIAHPSYGYFWLQHISPGGLYGVAIAATALILILLGARAGQRVWLASGVVVGALVVFFKVQIFAAAFPLLFSFAIIGWPLRKPWQWLILGGCVAAGTALLPLANHSYIGPNMRFDFSGTDWYWKILANMARGTRVESWYDVFRLGNAFPSHLALAISLLLLNALGIFAFLAPLVWTVAVWRKNWQASDGISLAAVVILLLMTFGLSRSGTAENVYEFMQHPFVWAYCLVGSLTAGRLYSMLAEGRQRLLTRVVVIAAIALAFLPVYYGAGLQRGKWAGDKVHSGIRVDRGLIDCAQYIRSQPPANALAQDSHLDKFLILGALAERPAFASRVDMWIRASKAFRESPYQRQLRELQTLQGATNVSELQRGVRETGIRWYVAHPDDPSVWPAEFRDHPAFESNGYRVYDMQSCFNLRG